MNSSQEKGRSDAEILEAYTRVLVPFEISRGSVSDAFARMRALRINEHDVWIPQDITEVTRDAYQHEVLPQVLSQLFGIDNHVRFAELSSSAANSMFSRSVTVQTNKGRELRKVALTHPWPGAEVFLSPMGVGVLSIAFDLIPQDKQPTLLSMDSLELNYQLTQLASWSVASLRVAHPSDDTVSWNSLTEKNRQQIPAVPNKAEPFTNRLNSPGASVDLTELINFLLSPLHEDPEYQVECRQALACTVLRLPTDFDFASEDARKTWGPVLSALAQVENRTHPLPSPESLLVENCLLNRNHWAAASIQGSAHLVTDQHESVEFNNQRALRCRDRYFMAYLWALMQRLSALRAGKTLVGVINDQNGYGSEQMIACAPKYRQLLSEMIEYNALNGIPDFSHRESLNQFYRLSLQSLCVRDMWLSIGSSVQNLDASCRTAQQEAILQRSVESLGKQVEILEESRILQAKVEWVEAFLIAVYFAELVHIVGGSLPFRHEYVGWFALIASLGALAIALCVLKPWESFRIKGLRISFVAVILILVAFLALGYSVFREVGREGKDNHSGH